MAAFSDPESNELEKESWRTQPSYANVLKWIWAFQGLIAVPRLFLIVFVSIIMLAMYPLHHSPEGAILIWM
jgi:hypothetical protein